jgi:hypothetical protein
VHSVVASRAVRSRLRVARPPFRLDAHWLAVVAQRFLVLPARDVPRRLPEFSDLGAGPFVHCGGLAVAAGGRSSAADALCTQA